MNLLLSFNYLRKTVYELFHFKLLLGTWWSCSLDNSNWNNRWVMVNFLYALNCLIVFIFISWCFLDVINHLFMIWDTHIFLAILILFTIASFSFYVFKRLSKWIKMLLMISSEFFMLKNVLIIIVSDFVKIIHIELSNKWREISMSKVDG